MARGGLNWHRPVRTPGYELCRCIHVLRAITPEPALGGCQVKNIVARGVDFVVYCRIFHHLHRSCVTAMRH